MRQVGHEAVGPFDSAARENALFRDPLAQAFATAGGLWPSSAPLPDDEAARRRRLAVSFSIIIRTKFLDDLLKQASASGVRQVVLLGAGTDSRAFRMDWPEGTRLFEVDTDAPLGFKASVLRQERAVARCERITVAVDLREDWPGALGAAGHDPATPTAWIAEGLLIYLPGDAAELQLARISAPTPGRAACPGCGYWSRRIRIKMLKRQISGRAGFELPHKRVL